MYDSYIRAIRWASDRIKDRGVVCYVSNGGYIDSNTADGLRKSLVDEFDNIYVFNLRGNQRSAGEQSRKEGGKIFGSGSRSTVAVLLLVKSGVTARTGTVRYRDIGDYLTREQKLDIVSASDLDTVDWQSIEPNEHGDWINQRREDFEAYSPISDRLRPAMFHSRSLGLATSRDAWLYNSSLEKLLGRVASLVEFYESQLARFTETSPPTVGHDLRQHVNALVDNDPTRISWSDRLKASLAAARHIAVDASVCRVAMYRPFYRQHVYFDRSLVDRPGRAQEFFPTTKHENVGFFVPSSGNSAPPFLCLMTNLLPDLGAAGISGVNFFPRWTYEEVSAEEGLFAEDGAEYGYRRVDNITESALADYQAAYGQHVTKDEIFYHVYGLLHSPTYRTEFAADLQKMLPRIPKVRDFAGFAESGRKLADLHVGYESVTPYSLEETVTGTGSDDQLYRVKKMVFGKGATAKEKVKTRIVYNSRITVAGIPADAYRYQLGSRSAIEWVMDRYQVRTDKASGIVNDPNDWATEHDEPRYILDLLERIVTVSMETMKIVDGLPSLQILEQR